jgi:phospholipid/cholesterol/gamma-HCH transport system substrate-binding protein
MTEHAKNMMVGMTVIVAMVLLGWMIILFTGLPNLLRSGYEVKIRMEARSQVDKGDKIHLGGKEVGAISDVSFTDHQNPYEGITITALVDSEITLPTNTVLWVTKRTLGRPWLEFSTEGDIPPQKAQTLSKLKPDTIVGHAKEASLMPDELAPALKGLATLSENLNKLIAPEAEPTATTGPTTSPDAKPGTKGLRGTLNNLNVTLAGLAEIFGNVENRANIKTSLANLATASEKADKAMDAMKEFADETRKSFAKVSGAADGVAKRVDQLAIKLIGDAEKISTLLSTINRIALKLEKGEGTAGKILNDPKLYNNLQEAAKQTKLLLKEFSDLVKTWKESGVKVNM